MNRKISTLIMCMFISGVFTSSANAQKKESHPAKQEKAVSEEEALAAKRAALAEKVAQLLRGREWEVYVTVKQATEKKPAVIETDAFTFTERTVLSKNLSAQGYAKNGSNYSLSVSDDGINAVWETMQLHENEKDMAFLRGELNVNSAIMTGGITYKYSDGKSVSYSYASIKPVETVPVVVEPQEEPKKSKKR